MNYRTFGNLDWKPSALGFGTMRLPVIGNDTSAIDEPQAIAMIRAGIDGGINYIDTAYPYHGGMSETLVGKALGSGYREKVRLATKMPSWLIHSQEDMTRYLEEQMRRLQTEHIDFYLLHALNAGYWHALRDADVIAWSEAQIRSGRIGHLGFSFHDSNAVFHEIIDAYDGWSFCQIQYNFLDEHNQAGTEGLHYAASRGLGVVVMEPLRGGKLARPSPAIDALWHEATRQRTPAEWALDWVWNHPEVSLLLSGMGTMEQVEQNLAAASRFQTGGLTPEELALVRSIRDAYQARIQVPCTGCRYCMPCPRGVDIPGLFGLLNEGAMFETWDAQRQRYGRMKEAKTTPDVCIRCGACEKKCPQQISIRDQLGVVASRFT